MVGLVTATEGIVMADDRLGAAAARVANDHGDTF
jgi:hypothetical protein